MSDYATQLNQAIEHGFKLWVRDYPTAWVVLHTLADREFCGEGGAYLKQWFDSFQGNQDWINYFDQRLVDCTRLNYGEEAIVTAIDRDRVLLMHYLHKHYDEGPDVLLERQEKRCLTANAAFPKEAALCATPLVRWK